MPHRYHKSIDTFAIDVYAWDIFTRPWLSKLTHYLGFRRRSMPVAIGMILQYDNFTLALTGRHSWHTDCHVWDPFAWDAWDLDFAPLACGARRHHLSICIPECGACPEGLPAGRFGGTLPLAMDTRAVEGRPHHQNLQYPETLPQVFPPCFWTTDVQCRLND